MKDTSQIARTARENVAHAEAHAVAQVTDRPCSECFTNVGYAHRANCKSVVDLADSLRQDFREAITGHSEVGA